jgi:hypothetical protein
MASVHTESLVTRLATSLKLQQWQLLQSFRRIVHRGFHSLRSLTAAISVHTRHSPAHRRCRMNPAPSTLTVSEAIQRTYRLTTTEYLPRQR